MNIIKTFQSRKLLLLDSSFNPITKAHLKMLSIAQLAAPSFEPVLMLSAKNADKGKASNLQQRLSLLNLLEPALPILTISEPLFSHKISLFPADFSLIFIVGYDTILRILDRKYYSDFQSEMKDLFKSAEFYVFDRDSHSRPIWERAEMQAGLEWKSKIKIFDAVSGASSSRVRELLREYYGQGTGLQELKEMVPGKVLGTILDNIYYYE